MDDKTERILRKQISTLQIMLNKESQVIEYLVQCIDVLKWNTNDFNRNDFNTNDFNIIKDWVDEKALNKLKEVLHNKV